MKTCTKCGYKNEDFRLNCKSCDAELSTKVVLQPDKMNSKSKDTPQNFSFFKSFLISLIAGLSTAVLLITACLMPWLSWLAWFAFVPFILAIHGRKRLQVYTITLILIAVYFTYISYIKSLLQYVPFYYLVGIIIVFTIAISEIQILCRRFLKWWCIPAALIYTAIIFIFRVFAAPGIINQIATYIGIIPVSQLISQHIAAAYTGYFLLLFVLLANGFTSEIIIGFNKQVKYFSIPVVIVIAIVCGMLGGPAPDTFSFNARSQGLVLQLESNHFRFFSKEKDKSCLKNYSKVLEDNYARVTTNLQTPLSQKVDIYVYSDDVAYHESSISNKYWSCANAVPVIKVIQVQNPNNIDNVSYDWYVNVIVHEFTHIVELSINPNNIPVWLQEGVASYEGKTYSNSELLLVDYPTLKDLETKKNNFGSDDDYKYSYSYVDYMVKTYGYDKLVALIKSPTKFKEIMSISEETFQKNWTLWVKKMIKPAN